MITITEQTNGVLIADGQKSMLFPKGVLSAHGNSGDNQSVDLRLMASRKNIISFPYDDCNLAESDAEETAEAIGEIL